ncbi:MAG: alpha/beta fold hydrolase [Nitriliruptoraceae bacterium]
MPAIWIAVTMILAACGDFWEEDFLEESDESAAAESASGESAPIERAPAELAGGSYSSPQLGDFSFAVNECPFEVDSPVDVDCGTLTVPESRTGDSDGLVEIAVAVLRTPSADPAADPVVYLNGGPGGVSLAEHWYWVTEPGEWRDHPILSDRDLILVDQRGTGYSRPSLSCDEEEFIEECHDRLVGEGVTLSAYSTPENAADLESLRLALEYDTWNLFGSSYGTRLAMAIVRDHPDGVRSMLLDGVYPLDVVPAYEMFFDNTLSALGEVVALCASQPACDDAYGDVNELLVAAIESVDADASTDLTGVDVFDLVFQALYSMETLVDVPYALWLFASGEIDGALEVLDAEPVDGFNPVTSPGFGRALDPAADSSGKFYSVECREEHHRTDIGRVDAQYDALFDEGVPEAILSAIYSSIYSPAVEVCPYWDSGEAHDDERAPVVSDVPSLLLAGRFDPITPRSWAELAAVNLTASTLIIAPSLSHSSVLDNACIDGLVAAFLNDPTVVLDTQCVVDLLPPAVTLP